MQKKYIYWLFVNLRQIAILFSLCILRECILFFKRPIKPTPKINNFLDMYCVRTLMYTVRMLLFVLYIFFLLNRNITYTYLMYNNKPTELMKMKRFLLFFLMVKTFPPLKSNQKKKVVCIFKNCAVWQYVCPTPK